MCLETRCDLFMKKVELCDLYNNRILHVFVKVVAVSYLGDSFGAYWECFKYNRFQGV